MRLHHVGRLCWGKIPTSDMALKQRHKTDEKATNDMRMGWNFDSKIQQTLLKFRNYRQKYNDMKTIESLHQFWPHFSFKGKGPGHSPMQGWHLPPLDWSMPGIYHQAMITINMIQGDLKKFLVLFFSLWHYFYCFSNFDSCQLSVGIPTQFS